MAETILSKIIEIQKDLESVWDKTSFLAKNIEVVEDRNSLVNLRVHLFNSLQQVSSMKTKQGGKQ